MKPKREKLSTAGSSKAKLKAGGIKNGDREETAGVVTKVMAASANDSIETRRVTRSSVKSKTTASLASVKSLSEQMSDVDELMSLNGTSDSNSQSEDSDFQPQVIPPKLSKQTATSKKINKDPRSKAPAVKKPSSTQKKPKCDNLLPLKVSDIEDESTSEEETMRKIKTKTKKGFTSRNTKNTSLRAKPVVIFKSQVKPHKMKEINKFRNLEDSTDQSDEDEMEAGTSKNTMPTLLNSRPVDYTFIVKENDADMEPSTSINNGRQKNSKTLDIVSILAIGESKSRKISTELSEASNSLSGEKSDADSSDESSVDWEEVNDKSQNLESSYAFPAEGIVVTLPNEGSTFTKKGKKEFDISEWIRKETNRNRQRLQVLMHKVNLLCLLAKGITINNCLLSEELLAIALSVLPSKQAYPPKHFNLAYLGKFLIWFRITYRPEAEYFDVKDQDLEEVLKAQLITKKCVNQDSQVFLFNTILRSLGVTTRLIWSFQPLTSKAPKENLLKPPTKTAENDGVNEIKKIALPSTSRKKSQSKCSHPAQLKAKVTTETKKRSRKIISSSDETEDLVPVSKPNQGRDFWAEVWLEEEERWVSVDFTTGNILCDLELEAKASQPVHYVLSFDSSRRVKDVTRRYARRWLTFTQKLRVDSEWWDTSLKPFRGRRNAWDKDEDDFLDRQLMSQPIPQTISACKGHPLFVIPRDLLKFEAIYPRDQVPQGFIKSIPVFSRDNVYTLHSRELWTRKAKVVRIGETPYKVVKARPKYDRFSNQAIKDLPLELFGEWQVEDFVPPEAKDGKVPRNCYGNVELFMEKMLPKGTVYLQLPALGRVAKKLDIDCAPALTGFEYGRGGSHPVFDGFVVCEEHKEILIDAWNQEQDQQRKKEEEKRQNRIYNNWMKLLKGLRIKQKIETKYSYSFSKRKINETEEEATSSATAEKRQKK